MLIYCLMDSINMSLITRALDEHAAKCVGYRNFQELRQRFDCFSEGIEEMKEYSASNFSDIYQLAVTSRCKLLDVTMDRNQFVQRHYVTQISSTVSYRQIVYTLDALCIKSSFFSRFAMPLVCYISVQDGRYYICVRECGPTSEFIDITSVTLVSFSHINNILNNLCTFGLRVPF